MDKTELGAAVSQLLDLQLPLITLRPSGEAPELRQVYEEVRRLRIGPRTIRAHLRDVREGRLTVLGAFCTDPNERRRFLRSGLKDFGKVFIVACVLDTTYQIFFLRSFYPGEVLVVAVVCAIVPYLLIRGLVLRSARLLYRKWPGQPEKPAIPPRH